MTSRRILGLNADESAALDAVARGVALIRRASDRNVAAYGDMSRAQFDVLKYLAEAPEGLRMYELADRLVLSRSTLTYHIAELEKAGLVTRQGGTSTQRAVIAAITQAGRDLLEEVRESQATLIRTHFIDCFTPEELAIVAVGFTRVAESFGEEAT